MTERRRSTSLADRLIEADREAERLTAETGRPAPSRRGGGRGFAYLAASRVVGQLAVFGASLYLARVFTPAQFGVIAIAWFVLNLGGLVADFGITELVLATSRLRHALLDAATTLSVLVVAACVALTCAAAYPLGVVYGSAELTALVLLASLNFVGGLGAVPRGLLLRAGRYRYLAVSFVAYTLIGSVTTIVLAASGFGPPSLVVGTVTTSTLVMVSNWVATRHRPRLRLGRAERGEVVGFVGGVLGYSTTSYASRNVDTLLLGRFAGFHELGLYNRAYNFVNVLSDQLGRMYGSVLAGQLRPLLTDRPALAQEWVSSVRFLLWLSASLGIGLFAVAPDLVPLLYGPQWDDMVPVLRGLALAIPGGMMVYACLPLFQVSGRTGLQLRVGLVASALFVVAVLVGLPWGARGVSVAVPLQASLWLPVPLVVAAGLCGAPVRTLARSLVGPLLAALAMGACVLAVGRVLHLAGAPGGAVLAVQVVVGLCVGVAALGAVLPERLQPLLQPLLRRLRRTTG